MRCGVERYENPLPQQQISALITMEGLRKTSTCLMSTGSEWSAWVMRSTNVRRMFARRFGCMLAIRYTSRTLKIHRAHDDIALQNK